MRTALFLLFLAFCAPVFAGPRLGLQSYTCLNMSFEQVVRFAAEPGIEEVQFYKRHLDPGDPEEVNLAKKALLAEHGVRAYSSFFDL